MSLLDTEHKRKSAVITAIILLLLLFGIFNIGMKYLDPPIEYGVSINFGNSDVGNGEPVEETLKESVEEVVEEVQEEVTKESVEEVSEEIIEEDVVTDDTVEEAPVIKKTEEKKEPVKEQPKKEEPKPKPKPSKATTDALNSLLNGASESGSTKGEGDDNATGVKGGEDGDPNSNKYYGNAGSGSGGNYNLAGRKALSKPIEKPNCQEEGKVVVAIQVNQSGKVIKAEQGRGTTNSAPCLVDAAVKAALKTTWNPDSKAPSTQKGTIIYNFSLSQ